MSGADGVEKLNSISTPLKSFNKGSGNASLAIKEESDIIARDTENVDDVVENQSIDLLNDIEEVKNEENDRQDVVEKKEEEVEIKKTNSNEIIVDVDEIIGGFEDARKVVKKIYNEVFLKTSNFKPTINDTVADLLAYIGALAEINGKENSYEKAFSIKPTTFAGKYKEKTYIPYAVKLCVWVDKNKGFNETYKLLDGILRSLFSLLKEDSESNTVSTIQNSISGVIDYLKKENIDIGF